MVRLAIELKTKIKVQALKWPLSKDRWFFIILQLFSHVWLIGRCLKANLQNDQCSKNCTHTRLAIRLGIKVDYFFRIMFYAGHIHYLIFRSCLRPSAIFNRTNVIHMTTSMSWRLNILCIMLKINRLPYICEGWQFTHMFDKCISSM
jgi:hypothetical protein